MEPYELTVMENGGVMMWPLAALAALGLVLFAERLLFLHKGQIRAEDFLAGIKNVLRKRRLLEALTVCEETPGPVPLIVKAALLHHDEGEAAMRRSIQSAALVEIPCLERRVGSLAAIASAAPLLGLLGTVLGMAKAFGDLAGEGAYAHMGVLAAGLSEALLSTAAGLVTAVLASLAHHFLHGRVRALVHEMEYTGHEMIQFIQREMPADSGLEETGKHAG